MRSTNIIIHGLREVRLDDRDARNKDEEDQMQDMLHAIRCDDVTVQNMSDLASMTARPVSRHLDQ